MAQGGHFFRQNAQTTPLDNLLFSIKADNVQDALQELRKQTVYEPEYTTTSANTTYNLTNNSSTLQIYTGTALNSNIRLPNATTISNGCNFIIANKSSATIGILNNSSSSLAELLADSIAVYFLQSNSTSDGVWVGYIVSGFATGILSYNLITNTAFTTNSTTFVPITGFSVTPVSGTYAVWYNASILYTTTPIAHYWAFFREGVIVEDSEREQITSRSNQVMVDTTQSVISFNGTQSLDVRVRRGTSGQITVNRRSLTLIRLGQG